MAAQPVPHPSTDKKRVKVYELRNNDWFDRGTGFCTAALQIVSPRPLLSLALVHRITRAAIDAHNSSASAVASTLFPLHAIFCPPLTSRLTP
jgi:hypothetical protein